MGAMRDNDDDGPRHDSGSLADGLGETVGDDPFGDGGFGDGDVESVGAEADTGAVGDETTPPGPEGDGADVTDGASGADGLDASGLRAQSASPLEGLGYILGEVRDALFGGDADGHDPGMLHDDAALPDDIDPSDDPGVIDA
jgi:hypothetical protein